MRGCAFYAREVYRSSARIQKIFFKSVDFSYRMSFGLLAVMQGQASNQALMQSHLQIVRWTYRVQYANQISLFIVHKKRAARALYKADGVIIRPRENRTISHCPIVLLSYVFVRTVSYSYEAWLSPFALCNAQAERFYGQNIMTGYRSCARTMGTI